MNTAPAQFYLELLTITGIYSRTSYPSEGYDEITDGSAVYRIQSLRTSDRNYVEQVQALLEQTFHADEVDPMDKLLHDLATEQIIIFAVLFNDRVISALLGGIVSINESELAFFISYAVTLPEYRNRGLSREAYITGLLDSISFAEKTGKRLILSAGECVTSSEGYWNTLGWKRIYKKRDDTFFEEIKYIQPALHFDTQTGAVLPHAREVPEHFMLVLFGSGHVTTKTLVDIVQAFYTWSNVWPRELFSNEEAYQNHLKYIQSVLSDFKNFLTNGVDFVLLSAEERKKQRQNGSIVLENPSETPSKENSSAETDHF